MHIDDIFGELGLTPETRDLFKRIQANDPDWTEDNSE